MTETEKLSKILNVLLIVGHRNGFFDPQSEYEHLVETRQTKQQLLKELSLQLGWHEKAIHRHNGLLDLIQEIILDDVSLAEINKRAKEIGK